MSADPNTLVKLSAGECSADQEGAIALWGYTAPTADTEAEFKANGYFNVLKDDVNPGSYIFINRPTGDHNWILKFISEYGEKPVRTLEVVWGDNPSPDPSYPTLHEFATTLTTGGTVEDNISCPGVLVGQFVSFSLNGDIEGPGPSAQPQAIAYAEVSAPNVVSVHWRVAPPAAQTANIWLSINSSVPTP